MSASSRIIWLTGRSRGRALFHHDALPLSVEIRPMRSARRLRLRYDEQRNLLTLTGPLRMNHAAALAWAAEQRHWVDAQLRSRRAAEPFVPGALIPVEGADTLLVWSEAEARSPRLVRDGAPPRIVSGGPRAGFEGRIERFLRKLALDLLSRETADCAAAAGLKVRAVSVGDASTRWGSCTSTGRIRYSWRLIMAPPAARRLVVAHEVAHVAHLDHGARFKALERELFAGEVAPARALLRSAAPRLRRLGRGH
jgi:predicted metal-dependent hydrolase